MVNELDKILDSNPEVATDSLDLDTLSVAGARYVTHQRLKIKDGLFHKHMDNSIETLKGHEVKVVIVRMAQSPSRMYYPASFDPTQYTKPTCWSSDSRVPDPEVTKPLSSSCNQCPYSVRNSVISNGTSCKISWLIAVVIKDDVEAGVFQFVVPSNSCWQKESFGKWGLKAYVSMLATNNVNASRLITKLHLDPMVAYPKVLFSPSSAVDSEYVEILKNLGESKEALNAVQLNVVPKLPNAESFGFSSEDTMQTDRKTEANAIVKKWSHLKEK
tara:strand:- start:1090 stop:1908 length:819 start_codon:yes stop_codon:yes gene_type:complete